MAATLADINDTLVSVDKNTQQTSKGITGFLSYLKTRDRKEDRKDLESDREKRKVATRATSGSSSSSGGRGFSLPSFNLPTVAGLLGGATLLGSKLLKRGVFGGILTAFADPIADFLLPGGKGNDEIREEVKKYLTGGLEGAGIGFLLFGKKGGIIGAILGALTKNPKVDKELGDLADNLGKLATVIFGKDYKGGMAKIARTISNTAGSGLERLNNLIEGKNFSTENINELKKDILGAAGVLGVFGFFASSKFRKSLTSLAFLKRLPLIAALTSVANLLGYSFSDNSVAEEENNIAGGGSSGPNMFETGAAVVGSAYLAKKTYDAFKNRGAASDQGGQGKGMKESFNRQNAIKQLKGNKNVKFAKDGVPIDNKGRPLSDSELKKLLDKYPRLGALKNLARVGPLALLFTALTAGDAYGIMNDNSLSKDQKAKMLGPMIFGALGATGMGLIGGSAGLMVGGPFGAGLGSLVLGSLGFFGGEVAGAKLAEFLLGGDPKLSPKEKKEFTQSALGKLMSGISKPDIRFQGLKKYDDVTSTIGLTKRLPTPPLAKARDTLERYEVNNPMFDKSYEGGSRSGNNLINNNNINMSNQSMIMGSAKSNDNENPLNTRLAIGLT